MKAWDILTTEEKSALSLTHNYGKSTWQAGEILNKAHYKYLEIQARANTFFKLFTLYLEKTEGYLIPENSSMDWDLQEYILCTIKNRMGYRETLKFLGKESPLTHKKLIVRTAALKKQLDWLLNHEDENHRELHNIIKEFDRWNNFRVLPEALREPSAFKRRNKTRLLKHLNNLKNLDPFHIDRLITKFSIKPSDKRNKTLYLPLVYGDFEKGYQIIPIKGTAKIVEFISITLNLYMFNEEGLADDYAFLVENYLSTKDKSCKQGQQFWPKFRLLIKKSSNYNQVNNIVPSRANLVNAFRDLDKIRVKKQKEIKAEDVSDPAQRGSDSKFWGDI